MDRFPLRRIRAGVTGLAGVFLLVLLGTALVSGREDVPVDASLATEPAEPLSEIGAAPGKPAEEAPPIDPIPIPIDPTTEELIIDEPARVSVPATPAPQRPGERPSQ
ncbi:hypothetical protein WJS89_05050 [Sphingomicrobium sp. XHP0235]|uniref:hypothetical protein n=1 Tax=Sphingomicrobium aquimarinum TaxID=3133971 RepID=UPI0031FE5C26